MFSFWHLGTVVSAGLLTLSHSPWDIQSLIWVSLIPWFYTISKLSNIRQVIFHGFLLSVLFSIGNFIWIGFVMFKVMQFPFLMTLILFSIYALFAQLQFVFASPFYYFLFRSRLTLFTQVLAGAMVYVFLDKFAPHFINETLGHTLHQNLRLIQFAEFSGVRGLTLLIVLVNLLLYFTIRLFLGKKRTASAAFLFITLVILGSLNYFGNSIYQHWLVKLGGTKESIRMSVIQGNVGTWDKIAIEKDPQKLIHAIVDRFVKMSLESAQSSFKPEVIVWPETTYPTEFTSKTFLVDAQKKVWDFAKKVKIPLLFGGYDRVGDIVYNSFYFMEAPQSLSVYHKSHLVPFVEYFPGSKNGNSWFKKKTEQAYSFGRGDGEHVYSVKNIKIAPLICYEALYGDVTQNYKNLGAELLLNVSNVSWFEPFLVAEQYLSNIVFRSIETRLPLLLATNTGIGVQIQPTGDLIGRGPENQSIVLNYTIPKLKSESTFYTVYGESWIYWGLLFSFSVLLVNLWRLRRNAVL